MATSQLTCCEREDGSKYRHKCNCPDAEVVCASEQFDCELCGFSEFEAGSIVPSVPPKKYRKQTNSVSQYVTCNCPDGTPDQRLSESVFSNGVRTYQGCTEPPDTILKREQRPYNCSDEDAVITYPIWTAEDWLLYSSSYVKSTTFAERHESSSADCGRPMYAGTQGRDMSSTLSDEDTEADAVSRATPTAGTL